MAKLKKIKGKIKSVNTTPELNISDGAYKKSILDVNPQDFDCTKEERDLEIMKAYYLKMTPKEKNRYMAIQIKLSDFMIKFFATNKEFSVNTLIMNFLDNPDKKIIKQLVRYTELNKFKNVRISFNVSQSERLRSLTNQHEISIGRLIGKLVRTIELHIC